jgi:hypothetical protein
MKCALILNDGRQVPLGAACYTDVVFSVAAEGFGAICISDDLKYDVKFVASA